jgi:transposase-like protein
MEISLRIPWVLGDLKDRGVKEIALWISDGGQAMLGAIAGKFPSSKRQRCVMHKMENVLSYVPAKQRDQVEPELKAWFYQKGRAQADQAVAAFIEKYQHIYPTAIECLQRDLDACFTFYSFPKTKVHLHAGKAGVREIDCIGRERTIQTHPGMVEITLDGAPRVYIGLDTTKIPTGQ